VESPYSAEVTARTADAAPVSAATIQGILRTSSFTFGDQTQVSFLTVNDPSIRYSLCVTNDLGLATPLSAWPTLTPFVIGNGQVQTLVDFTVENRRFYGVVTSR